MTGRAGNPQRPDVGFCRYVTGIIAVTYHNAARAASRPSCRELRHSKHAQKCSRYTHEYLCRAIYSPNLCLMLYAILFQRTLYFRAHGNFCRKLTSYIAPKIEQGYISRFIITLLQDSKKLKIDHSQHPALRRARVTCLRGRGKHAGVQEI